MIRGRLIWLGLYVPWRCRAWHPGRWIIGRAEVGDLPEAMQSLGQPLVLGAQRRHHPRMQDRGVVGFAMDGAMPPTREPEDRVEHRQRRQIGIDPLAHRGLRHLERARQLDRLRPTDVVEHD